ncbi:transcriptional regulator family: Fungal Specific TF [Penicillium samsonianum]|uniref:transcriptional regulator family: Fungal Specific TF n=1 Tax=Penicillium samsonianum TaxID=1882272 RepID=UPI002546ABFA|nr:transcriptional regulator family: Fungal Specific TF [Penicillium samsonianum]KAJ6132614.1 transcriptional regulator family: Fungal Specific TF [Penicillium samsonianum]
MESGDERPYRSHTRPACVPCRRRKSRCKLEPHIAACLMCRAHGTECTFPNGKAKSTPQKRYSTETSPLLPHPTLRTPIAAAQSLNRAPPVVAASPQFSIVTQAQNDKDTPLSLEADDDNPHILGPAVTGDNHVLADYLSNISGGQGIREIRPVEPGSSSSPVIFTKVQKKPLGLMVNSSPALHKLQTIEKLVEPWGPHLIDIYLRKINPCLPLLEESSFRVQYTNARHRISPALLACLYAHVLTQWQHDPLLSRERCPDVRFVWNLAIEASYSELHASAGISTIKAILLDVGGRPTTSMTGNGVRLGSAVALCHSLGLNRNPLPWDIPREEKHLRMKIWWSILLHDRWSSLAYGTPPHIRRSQYDVPLPISEYLSDWERDHEANAVFIELMNLTDVLDHCLEQVYSIRIETQGPTRNLELELNKWVDSLTGDIRKIIIRGSNLNIPGASNLRLAYLATRLLLRRIDLDRERQAPDPNAEHMANRVMEARRTAEDIVVLVQELGEAQLGDFWLPVVAFTFSATVTFLIRCALETEQAAGLAQSGSLRMASDLLDSLRSHHKNFGWDLGDICLAQHSDVIDKLLRSDPPVENSEETNVELRQPFVPDMAFLDDMFPSTWDILQIME